MSTEVEIRAEFLERYRVNTNGRKFTVEKLVKMPGQKACWFARLFGAQDVPPGEGWERAVSWVHGTERCRGRDGNVVLCCPRLPTLMEAESELKEHAREDQIMADALQRWQQSNHNESEEVTMAILDGRSVDADQIDPAKHRFIGTWRPPTVPECFLPEHARCPCGEEMNTETSGGFVWNRAFKHWQKGCFDEPQYVTIQEEAAA